MAAWRKTRRVYTFEYKKGFTCEPFFVEIYNLLSCLFDWFPVLVLIAYGFAITVTFTIAGAFGVFILAVMVFVTGRFTIFFTFIGAGAMLSVVVFLLAVFVFVANWFTVRFTVVGAGSILARGNVCLRLRLTDTEFERHNAFFNIFS